MKLKFRKMARRPKYRTSPSHRWWERSGYPSRVSIDDKEFHFMEYEVTKAKADSTAKYIRKWYKNRVRIIPMSKLAKNPKAVGYALYARKKHLD